MKKNVPTAIIPSGNPLSEHEAIQFLHVNSPFMEKFLYNTSFNENFNGNTLHFTGKKFFRSQLNYIFTEKKSFHSQLNYIFTEKKSFRSQLNYIFTEKKFFRSQLNYIFTEKKSFHSQLNYIFTEKKSFRSQLNYIFTEKKSFCMHTKLYLPVEIDVWQTFTKIEPYSIPIFPLIRTFKF